MFNFFISFHSKGRLNVVSSTSQVADKINFKLQSLLFTVVILAVAALVLVDRQEGGREAIESRGIPVFPMFTRASIFGDK